MLRIVEMTPKKAVILVGGFLFLIFYALGQFPGQLGTPLPTKAPTFTQEQMNAAVLLIRLHGYSCKTPLSMRDMWSASGGYVVHCEGDEPNRRYGYDIEDRGGHWTVTLR